MAWYNINTQWPKVFSNLKSDSLFKNGQYSRLWLVITKIVRPNLGLDALQLGHDEAVVGGVAGVVQKAGQPPLRK